MVIEIERFSSLYRLLTVTATVKKIVERWKAKLGLKDQSITATEVNNALFEWIIHCQLSLSSASTPSRHPKAFEQLGLGVIRCRGRLGDSSLPRGTKEPILLPKDNKLTDLIIQASHCRRLHAGTRQTLVDVRQTY